MTRLILHAGAHKTGTTAIQTFAMMNRAALAERGWIYPGLAPYAQDGKMPHILMAHALANKGGDRLAAGDAMQLPRRWADQADAAGADVFVSGEPFYRHVLPQNGQRDWASGRRAYLRRLARIFEPFEVEPVLVFRRPDDFVRALYQESVKTNLHPRWRSLTDFYREGRNSMLRYADNAELLAEVFPQTRVLIYEDLAASGDFCANFFAAIGIDAAGLPEPGRVRPGLSATQVAAKLALEELDEKNRSNVDLMRLVRSPRVQAVLDQRVGAGPFGFWADSAERARILEARAEDVERLRSRFLPDRATLFPPLSESDPPPVPIFSKELRDALAAAASKQPAQPGPARRAASVVARTVRKLQPRT